MRVQAKMNNAAQIRGGPVAGPRSRLPQDLRAQMPSLASTAPARTLCAASEGRARTVVAERVGVPGQRPGLQVLQIDRRVSRFEFRVPSDPSPDRNAHAFRYTDHRPRSTVHCSPAPTLSSPSLPFVVNPGSVPAFLISTFSLVQIRVPGQRPGQVLQIDRRVPRFEFRVPSYPSPDRNAHAFRYTDHRPPSTVHCPPATRG